MKIAAYQSGLNIIVVNRQIHQLLPKGSIVGVIADFATVTVCHACKTFDRVHHDAANAFQLPRFTDSRTARNSYAARSTIMSTRSPFK
jgi:hypothetical protein